ncbi:ArsR/SmtB family transcription factor [Jannaschia donghaensis]|uniref:Helix-turn-helix domain protein n=1 Tax=Jannaschia donghaensis TaxID=420998 RepID=A0A0M6YKH9_9RHOB|nr:winged helix-turn-helix domain-containing protein [Jannaschia donghaensis]CTQ50175.1 Helix-turn-helix domain protein [Jannaschia donghaensis]
MRNGPDIAATAALIGDPARAAMLSALMDGHALTATELAAEGGVTPQTASAHLAKLERGGLLARARQGRHSYFRLASADVAQVLEALMTLSHGTGPRRTRPGPRDAALRVARVCYNHLAGAEGVALFEALRGGGALRKDDDILRITDRMRPALAPLGVDPAALPGQSAMCRTCLDWSERRHHLAGRLGRAILSAMEAKAWVRRDPASRAVVILPKGRIGIDRVIGLAAANAI